MTHGLYGPWNSPGQNTGVGSCSLLQGISNPGIEPRSPALQVDSYHLSHKGSPRILEWVAYPFSSRSSQSRDQTRVSCIAGGFFYQLSYQGNNVVLNSAVQQSDSVIHTHTHTHTCVHVFHIVFHYSLSWDIKYNFLHIQ